MIEDLAKDQLQVLRKICHVVQSHDNEKTQLQEIDALLGNLISKDAFYFAHRDRNHELRWKFVIENGQLRKLDVEDVPSELIDRLLAEGGLTLSTDDAPPELQSLLVEQHRDITSITISAIPDGNELGGAFMLASRQGLFTENDTAVLTIISSLFGMSKNQYPEAKFTEENEHLRSIVELAGSVGHELNQPLTGIAGYCALIKEDLDEDDPIYHDIVKIEKQAARLEKLVYKFQSIVDLEKTSNDDEGDKS